jgi:hypothetical protein
VRVWLPGASEGRAIRAAAWASPAARRTSSHKEPPCCRHTLLESSGFVPISTSSWGGSSEGGNGEQQIEGARRGAGTRQEARAASASRSSAHFVGASIVGA